MKCDPSLPLQDNPNRFGMSENEAFFALAIKKHLSKPIPIPHNLVEYFLVQPNPYNPRQMQMFMELLHCKCVRLHMKWCTVSVWAIS